MITNNFFSMPTSDTYCALQMPSDMNEEDLELFREWLALIIKGAERRTVAANMMNKSMQVVKV